MDSRPQHVASFPFLCRAKNETSHINIHKLYTIYIYITYRSLLPKVGYFQVYINNRQMILQESMIFPISVMRLARAQEILHQRHSLTQDYTSGLTLRAKLVTIINPKSQKDRNIIQQHISSICQLEFASESENKSLFGKKDKSLTYIYICVYDITCTVSKKISHSLKKTNTYIFYIVVFKYTPFNVYIYIHTSIYHISIIYIYI